MLYISIMPKVKHSQERLQLIDQLLAQRKKLMNREEFCRQVNQKLRFEQISVTSLDKDLRYLREEVGVNDIEILFTPALGYHYSVEGYSHFTSSLNDDDKVMLVVAQNLFQMFKETQLKERFRELVDKVVKNNGTARFWEDISKLDFIHLEWGFSLSGNRWLPDLVHYIFEKQQIRVHYGKEKIKNLSPYLLKQHRGKWYLIAFDHDIRKGEQIKIYALDRIKEILPGPLSYFKDPDFQTEDYFRHSLGIWHQFGVQPLQVQLEFTGDDLIDHIAQNPVHRSQQIIRQTKTSLLLSIHVYDTIELEGLILHYGPRVTVREPEMLRKRITSILEETLKNYAP